MCAESLKVSGVSPALPINITWPISDYKYIVLGKYSNTADTKWIQERGGLISQSPTDREGPTASSWWFQSLNHSASLHWLPCSLKGKATSLQRIPSLQWSAYTPRFYWFHTTIFSLAHISLVLMACLLSLWVQQAHGCHKISVLSLPRTFFLQIFTGIATTLALASAYMLCQRELFLIFLCSGST